MIPICLIKIDDNTYQCPIYKFKITTQILPIECNACEKISNIGHIIKLPPPTPVQLAQNFTKAMVKFAKSGLKLVSKQEYEKRLQICNSNQCGYYEKGRCLHPACGCFLSKKCWIKSENCPLDLWNEKKEQDPK